MDLRQGVLATANALGMDPVDLATIISYETAGTFDPTKRGPTTQWGQHRGLIQFGEPQAKQYGVDWNDPLGSQLGPDGAVANYFRKNGYKPGMGLLDAYSIVNAGGPGLYNRSDANNGGAPGTVADKVNTQMEGHRKKAAALLGGEVPPPAMSSNPSISTQGAEPMTEQPKGLLGGLLSPEKRDHLIMALEGMTLNPNQGLMQAAAARQGARIEDARNAKKTAKEQQELQQRRNKTAEWLKANGRDDLAAAVQSGVMDGAMALTETMKAPKERRIIKGADGLNYYEDGSRVLPGVQAPAGDTSFIVSGERAAEYGLPTDGRAFQITTGPGGVQAKGIGGGNTVINNNMGPDGIDYGKPGDGLVWQRDGAGNIALDERGAPVAIPFQGGSAWVDRQEKVAEGEAAAQQQQKKAETEATQSNAAIAAISDIRRIMAPKSGVARAFDLPEAGVVGGALAKLGINQEAVDVRNKLDTLKGAVGFERLQSMRDASPTGGALGAISERELQLLSSVLGSLDQTSSPEELLKTLDFIENVMRKAAAYPNAEQYGFGGAPSDMDDDELFRRYGVTK